MDKIKLEEIMKARGLDPIPTKPIEIKPMDKLFNLHVGDDILFNNTTGDTFGNLQKDVQHTWGTEYALTHYATGFYPQSVQENGEWNVVDQIFQASELINVQPGDLMNTGHDFWIYRLNNVNQEVMNTVVTELWKELIGSTYAYAQILYYLREEFFLHNDIGKLLYPLVKNTFHGGKEIQNWGNWFPSSIVCSELFHRKMRRYCNIIPDQEISSWLDKWDESNISPVGVKKIFNALPHKWSLIYKKETIEYKNVQ